MKQLLSKNMNKKKERINEFHCNLNLNRENAYSLKKRNTGHFSFSTIKFI